MFITEQANHIPQLGGGWDTALANILYSKEFHALMMSVGQECLRGEVYPKTADIFRAFHLTPFRSTRVVLLGQDPYHGAGEAHGLCFSVPAGQRHPPSLRNIFKELQRDLGMPVPLFGDLSGWARQGVLMLNTSLTVRKGQAGSHQHLGWERFTDAVISTLSANGEPGIIFLLWGAHAAKKESLIDPQRHHVLKAPHPSPLSAYKGFLGCGHFSRVNELLLEQGRTPIDWNRTWQE